MLTKSLYLNAWLKPMYLRFPNDKQFTGTQAVEQQYIPASNWRACSGRKLTLSLREEERLLLQESNKLKLMSCSFPRGMLTLHKGKQNSSMCSARSFSSNTGAANMRSQNTFWKQHKTKKHTGKKPQPSTAALLAGLVVLPTVQEKYGE